MRQKWIYVLLGLAAVLLIRNLYVILYVLPDEKEQGPIYRVIFFHLPAFFTAGLCYMAALLASLHTLLRQSSRADALAVAATEVGLAFAAVNLITGMIWARIIWGIWWTWDARLTWALICWLIYAGYLMLRHAIEDPTQRARHSAVLNVFAFAAVIITWKAIEWWRTQHPGPVLSIRGARGAMDPAMESMIYQNWLALLLLGAVLVALRLDQEQIQREVEALRRQAHAKA